MSGQPLRVAGLFRYPVKSLDGEEVHTLNVGPSGAHGDRVFALFDVLTGRVLTAKRFPQLLTARACWRGGDAKITLPQEAGSFYASESRANRVLSNWLGRQVRIERRQDSRATVDYQINPDVSTELTSFDLPKGTFFDTAPLHLITDSSLHDAARGWPDGDWNPHRFRSNAFLTGSLPPDEQCVPQAVRTEDGWLGCRLAIGDAVLLVVEKCMRCVMVNYSADGTPGDPALFRWLVRHRSGNLGIYAEAIRSGTICHGDQATVLPPIIVQLS